MAALTTRSDEKAAGIAARIGLFMASVVLNILAGFATMVDGYNAIGWYTQHREECFTKLEVGPKTMFQAADAGEEYKGLQT